MKHSDDRHPFSPLPTYTCRVAVLSCEEKAELKERITDTIAQEEKE